MFSSLLVGNAMFVYFVCITYLCCYVCFCGFGGCFWFGWLCWLFICGVSFVYFFVWLFMFRLIAIYCVFCMLVDCASWGYLCVCLLLTGLVVFVFDMFCCFGLGVCWFGVYLLVMMFGVCWWLLICVLMFVCVYCGLCFNSGVTVVVDLLLFSDWFNSALLNLFVLMLFAVCVLMFEFCIASCVVFFSFVALWVVRCYVV